MMASTSLKQAASNIVFLPFQMPYALGFWVFSERSKETMVAERFFRNGRGNLSGFMGYDKVVLIE